MQSLDIVLYAYLAIFSCFCITVLKKFCFIDEIFCHCFNLALVRSGYSTVQISQKSLFDHKIRNIE